MSERRAPISPRSTYAILGCGSVGHAVAEALDAEGKDVLILDKDETRVEALRDQDLNAQTADIKDPSVTELVEDRNVILILSSDVDANTAAVEHIRGTNAGKFLVVRASDPVTGEELADLGVDVVINPSEVIADSAVRAVETGELEYKAGKLAGLLEGADGTLAIVTHDNPDPDSIASGVALQAIADRFGIEADILYLGEIGHQENRAFANLLGIEIIAAENPGEFADYGMIALVDATKGSPMVDREIDIFIDHKEPEQEIDALFVDVRPNVSSTSTILTKYVQEFDIKPTKEVATALLYGIRAETLDFKRETTPADLTAAAYLYPFADHDTLEQVESPSMSPETLDVLAEAITNREIQGSHLFSNAGFVRDRDALTRAAQHLLDLEGITTTAVFGIVDETIHIAARSKDIRLNIQNTLEDAFGDRGDVVGHSTQASAEIDLGIFTGIDATDETRETLLNLTNEAVKRKLFDAIGVERGNGS